MQDQPHQAGTPHEAVVRGRGGQQDRVSPGPSKVTVLETQEGGAVSPGEANSLGILFRARVVLSEITLNDENSSLVLDDFSYRRLSLAP